MALNAPDVAPQVGPAIRESNDTTPTTFGGGPGVDQQTQEFQKIASSAGEIGVFEKIRADQTNVEEAKSRAMDYTQNALYNPDTGAMGAKGKDALAAQVEASKNIKAFLNDQSSKLSGSTQFGPFNKWAQEHFAVVNQTLLQHSDKETQEHEQAVTNNTIDQSVSGAALSHGNPDAVNHYLDTALGAVDKFAQNNRLDADASQKLKQDTYDKVQLGVIKGMMKFQPDDSAQKYFASVKDNMSKTAQESITDDLQEADVTNRGLKAAQDAIKANPDSEAQALKAVAGIDNPKMQEIARKNISETFSQNRQATKNDQDNTYMQMQQMLSQKGITDSSERRAAVVRSGQWNNLSSEQQRALEKGGTPDVTSIKAWEDFTKAVTSGDIKKMSDAEINVKFISNFDATDQKTAADYMAGLKKTPTGRGAGGPKEKMFESLTQQVNSTLVGTGVVNAKSPTNSQLQIQKQVLNSVNAELLAQQAATGKPPEPEDIKKVIDKHVLPVISKEGGRWFPAVPYEKIPDSARQDIIDYAQKIGIVADKEKIEDAYKYYRIGDIKNTKKALQ